MELDSECVCTFILNKEENVRCGVPCAKVRSISNGYCFLHYDRGINDDENRRNLETAVRLGGDVAAFDIEAIFRKRRFDAYWSEFGWRCDTLGHEAAMLFPLAYVYTKCDERGAGRVISSCLQIDKIAFMDRVRLSGQKFDLAEWRRSSLANKLSFINTVSSLRLYNPVHLFALLMEVYLELIYSWPDVAAYYVAVAYNKLKLGEGKERCWRSIELLARLRFTLTYRHIPRGITEVLLIYLKREIVEFACLDDHGWMVKVGECFPEATELFDVATDYKSLDLTTDHYVSHASMMKMLIDMARRPNGESTIRWLSLLGADKIIAYMQFGLVSRHDGHTLSSQCIDFVLEKVARCRTARASDRPEDWLWGGVMKLLGKVFKFECYEPTISLENELPKFSREGKIGLDSWCDIQVLIRHLGLMQRFAFNC